MKTILVPTDFSPSANNAMHYTLNLAKIYAAKIVLFHAYNLPLISSEAPIDDEELQAMRSWAMESLKREARELEKELPGSVEMVMETSISNPENLITEAIKQYHADLVVMGIKIEKDIMERIFGGTTSYLIRHTSVPVILVPQHYKFKFIDKIVVGCDRIEAFTQPITDGIKLITNMFHAKLILIRLLDVEKTTESTELEKLEKETHLDVLSPEYRIAPTLSHIEDGIDSFAVKENADLVVLLPQKHNILNRMLRGSVTNRLAGRSHKPLLIFPPDINVDLVHKAFEANEIEQII